MHKQDLGMDKYFSLKTNNKEGKYKSYIQYQYPNQSQQKDE